MPKQFVHFSRKLPSRVLRVAIDEKHIVGVQTTANPSLTTVICTHGVVYADGDFDAVLAKIQEAQSAP